MVRPILKEPREEEDPVPKPQLFDEKKTKVEEESEISKLNHPEHQNQGFLSTTTREGQWMNRENPFAKTYKLNSASHSRYKIKEKHNRIQEIWNKVFRSEERNAPPFNTSGKWSEIVIKAQGPDPGSYIDPSNPKNSSFVGSSVIFTNEKVRHMKGHLKKDFGSKVKRF